MTVIFLAKYLVLVFPLFLVYLIIVKKEPKTVIYASLAALIAKGLEVIAELVLHVPRPFVTRPDLPYYRGVRDGWMSDFLGESGLHYDSSFFSAHAAVSFAVATVVYLTYKRRAGLILFLLAGLVALGRVIANIHYPLDIIYGAGVGVWVGFIVTLGVSYYAKNATSWIGKSGEA